MKSELVASEYFGLHEPDGETPKLILNNSKLNKSTQQSIGSGFNVKLTQNQKNLKIIDQNTEDQIKFISQKSRQLNDNQNETMGENSMIGQQIQQYILKQSPTRESPHRGSPQKSQPRQVNLINTMVNTNQINFEASKTENMPQQKKKQSSMIYRYKDYENQEEDLNDNETQCQYFQEQTFSHLQSLPIVCQNFADKANNLIHDSSGFTPQLGSLSQSSKISSGMIQGLKLTQEEIYYNNNKDVEAKSFKRFLHLNQIKKYQALN